MVLIVAFFVLKNLLKENLPRNLIRSLTYGRNTVNIQFIPETVTIAPEFTFQHISKKQYLLKISDSSLRYNYVRNYNYGAIERIESRQGSGKSIQFSLTFSTLTDTPEVHYIENPPLIKIHFNKYLDHKYIIVLDPGHGGNNTGAVGPNGTVEKDLTLDIALRLEKLLKQKKELEVFLTRRQDHFISLFTRRRMSNFWDPDLFVSIHMNSATNKSVNQTEIYYAHNRSLQSARIIRDELQQGLKIGRGLIRRRGYAVIRGNTARLGAVLVEVMYLSNPAGERLLLDQTVQDEIIKRLHQAIHTIFDQSM